MSKTILGTECNCEAIVALNDADLHLVSGGVIFESLASIYRAVAGATGGGGGDYGVIHNDFAGMTAQLLDQMTGR